MHRDNLKCTPATLRSPAVMKIKPFGHPKKMIFFLKIIKKPYLCIEFQEKRHPRDKLRYSDSRNSVIPMTGTVLFRQPEQKGE
jgi:hypothetical protein